MKILVAILLPILMSQVVGQSGSGDLDDEDLGRAHHMFSQILKLRIYEFIFAIFFFFFYKFSIEIKNANITAYHNRKWHFAAL